MASRKGFTQFYFGATRALEQNKESVITASVFLYAMFYLFAGLGGISFNTQPALGYVESITNTAPPSGSVWVENSSLHWGDGSTEYFTTTGGVPLSVWSFSQGSGKAIDRYGDNDGNLEGGASITSGAGYYGNGLSLGGTSGEGVDYGGIWDDHTQSRTFALWFKENGASNGDRILSQDCSEWFCVLDNGADSIQVDVDGASYTPTYSIDESNWHHLTLSFNEATSTMKVYIDGSQVDSYSYSSGWSHQARPIVLGGNTEDYGDISGGEWEGSIDEFKMYSGVLNGQQVQEMYNKGRDRFRAIKGSYHFDSGSGQTAVDSSGWNKDGKLGGTTSSESSDPSWTSGKFDNALDFDGSDDYVNVSGGTVSKPATVSAWVYIRKSASEEGGETNIPLLDGNKYSVRVEQHDQTGKYGFTEYGVSDYTFNTNTVYDQWVHVAWVFDNSESRLFLNGELKDTNSNTIDVPLDQIAATAGGRFFDGKIDEVKVYSRALSKARIQELAEGAGSKPGGPIGSTWVEGENLRIIDESGYERLPRQVDTGVSPSGASGGNAWMEAGYLHYVSPSGVERAIQPFYNEDWEPYKTVSEPSHYTWNVDGTECWEVNQKYAYSGNQSLGNDYNCDEISGDDEGNAGYPTYWKRFNIPAGANTVRVNYWFKGITFDGSGCSDPSLAGGEDESRMDLIFYDETNSQVGSWTGPTFSGLGKVSSSLSDPWMEYEPKTVSIPAGAVDVRVELEGGDNNGNCGSLTGGGNAGGYYDNIQIAFEK